MEALARQKEEIVRMLESVNNLEVLEAVRNLLRESEDVYGWKEPLNVLAEEAEKEIERGNVYTSEEFKAKIDAKLANRR